MKSLIKVKLDSKKTKFVNKIRKENGIRIDIVEKFKKQVKYHTYKIKSNEIANKIAIKLNE